MQGVGQSKSVGSGYGTTLEHFRTHVEGAKIIKNGKVMGQT